MKRIIMCFFIVLLLMTFIGCVGQNNNTQGFDTGNDYQNDFYNSNNDVGSDVNSNDSTNSNYQNSNTQNNINSQNNSSLRVYVPTKLKFYTEDRTENIDIQYDAKGNATRINMDGFVMDHTYDHYGNLLFSSSDGKEMFHHTYVYGYDGIKQKATFFDGTYEWIQYEYDLYGNATHIKSSNQEYRIENIYDNKGRLSGYNTYHIPSGEQTFGVVYEYDSQDNLILADSRDDGEGVIFRLSYSGNNIVSCTYEWVGDDYIEFEKTYLFENGKISRWEYSQKTAGGNNESCCATYQYDSNGNCTSMKITRDGTMVYGWDITYEAVSGDIDIHERAKSTVKQALSYFAKYRLNLYVDVKTFDFVEKFFM